MRLLALFSLVAVGCAPLSAQQSSPPVSPMASVDAAAEPPQIATSAIGESRLVPDRALIDIGVQTRAATAEQAAAENARRVQAVLAALRALGLSSEQLTTVNYSVYPETRYDERQGDREPRVIGYNVVNSVRAEVQRQEQVGPVIDAALKAGANVINSLSFYASDPAPARREAMVRAVEKARADAEVLARAAGGSLGRLLELVTTEAPGFPQPMLRRGGVGMAAAEMAQTSIEPGRQTITVVVSARWEFRPAAQ